MLRMKFDLIVEIERDSNCRIPFLESNPEYFTIFLYTEENRGRVKFPM